MFGRKKKQTPDNGLPPAGQVSVAPAVPDLGSSTPCATTR
jgi:hypothetical protein